MKIVLKCVAAKPSQSIDSWGRTGRILLLSEHRLFLFLILPVGQTRLFPQSNGIFIESRISLLVLFQFLPPMFALFTATERCTRSENSRTTDISEIVVFSSPGCLWLHLALIRCRRRSLKTLVFFSGLTDEWRHSVCMLSNRPMKCHRRNHRGELQVFILFSFSVYSSRHFTH